MKYLIGVLLILILCVFATIKSGFANSTVGNFDAYAVNTYTDRRTWMIIDPRQKPFNLFTAYNTFHTGDTLYAYFDEWVPVARVLSILEVDAFPVLIIDREVPLYDRKIKSIGPRDGVLFPDQVKSPYREIQTVSQYMGDYTPQFGDGVRAPHTGAWAPYKGGDSLPSLTNPPLWK